VIQAEKIAQVLGIESKIHSLAELSAAVAHGLPKKTLQVTIKRLTQDPDLGKRISAKLIPPATFKRRKNLLNPQESERVERLARIFAAAFDIWDDESDTQQFLFTPHPILKGKTPVETAFTELGAREVEQLLANIKYGLPV